MLKYENRIREIIVSTIKTNVPVDNIGIYDNLRDFGMDSLSFITLIIEIENTFHIEFPNDKLFISDAGTIDSLNRIVEQMLA